MDVCLRCYPPLKQISATHTCACWRQAEQSEIDAVMNKKLEGAN